MTKVKANKELIYGSKRIAEGEEFEIDEQDKEGMSKVDIFGNPILNPAAQKPLISVAGDFKPAAKDKP